MWHVAGAAGLVQARGRKGAGRRRAPPGRQSGDHEALRIALNVDKVNWLGISYGAQLAANYAAGFPRHTRAMVIDAALDHSQAETAQVSDEIIAVQDGFNRFAGWCDTTPACALRGRDVGAVFDALVVRADASPIQVEGALRPVTGEDIRMKTKDLLATKDPVVIAPGSTWVALSQALAAALAGDASAFMLFPAGVPQDGADAISANACTDYVPQVDSWAEMQQRMQLGRQLAPHMQGASHTWRVLGCIGWPVKATNPPRALDVRGVPTLLVHAVHDPQDPYRWTYGLATQIHGSDMLTRTGDGHTSTTPRRARAPRWTITSCARRHPPIGCATSSPWPSGGPRPLWTRATAGLASDLQRSQPMAQRR